LSSKLKKRRRVKKKVKKNEWDWDEYITFCLGQLCLKPDEFWRMSPREVFYMADGYHQRHDAQMQIVAWHAAHTMNVHLSRKDQISGDFLLGKSKKKRSNAPMNTIEREMEVEKLREAMAGRRKQDGNR
jgi:uncharacterized phage protein (TIGR02216 family)